MGLSQNVPADWLQLRLRNFAGTKLEKSSKEPVLPDHNLKTGV